MEEVVGEDMRFGGVGRGEPWRVIGGDPKVSLLTGQSISGFTSLSQAFPRIKSKLTGKISKVTAAVKPPKFRGNGEVEDEEVPVEPSAYANASGTGLEIKGTARVEAVRGLRMFLEQPESRSA